MSDEETGSGPDPVICKNRGGRPRKDGARTDTAPTLAERGFSKRVANRCRRLAALSHQEFEDVLAKMWATPRRHDIEYFLPDHHGNSRYQRETRANISRLQSTLWRLWKDHEFDSSETGALMRAKIRATARVWLSDVIEE
jgi:hypothetical protein